jgi:hypothetical protein
VSSGNGIFKKARPALDKNLAILPLGEVYPALTSFSKVNDLVGHLFTADPVKPSPASSMGLVQLSYIQ